ncbi:sensor histidine kinase [Paracidobacterium acidisoli]|uniref:histidine kinase n=1 Tax=Paracidobacterium acidisoli TaxID=2303751 RepID=A0A372ISC4_9BACT|nr:ATP-binding protein [Paracidobacterium acidisoli]MBT9330771.1 PAS domain-containing sensor histidine kinase [Paracidobacterium acidisoli]
MRLKTKLVTAITSLVFVLATVISWLYLSRMLQQHIEQSWLSTDIVAHQVLFQVRLALETGLRNRPIDLNDPRAVRTAVAESLRQDPGLNSLLTSVINYSPTVLDIAVADHDGRALIAAPDPTQDDQMLPLRPDYATLRNKSLFRILRIVFGPPRVFNVTLGLERNNQPFVTVRVGIRTTFLQNAFHPWLYESFTFIGLAIVISLIVAAFMANLALQPMELISRRLDLLTTQAGADAEAASEAEAPRSVDAVAQVSGKIERLGRRMRNVEEVFSALKENLDQILSNLQDGMMLFTRDSRAVLVSSSIERFLDVHRDHILGAEVRDIFHRNTRLGRTIRDAFDAGMSIVQEEVTTETGRRVAVSLDFIHDDRSQDRHSLGALLTLHDLESVREIESELEVSRRLAAIGRLTAGVGHEVKNPINAIVVHLELLRNKIEREHGAIRHLDVIQSEIARLDRVVQTLVDFSRPVELQLRVQDLRDIVSSVLNLASAEFETRQVRVVSRLPDRPVIVRVDADLLRQALLNVVLNGAQAMASGGDLEVRLSEDSRLASLSVRDHGDGIPDEIRGRIFDLYFTTKKDGSGIGLAMTYRILQLHHGQLDVESKPGSGSTFTFRLPINPADQKTRSSWEPETAVSEGLGQ